MNSELEVLKKIWENNGRANVRLISRQSGLGMDYTNFICKSLLRKAVILPVKNKPGRYRVTVRGKKELRALGIIRPKASKKASSIKKIPRRVSGSRKGAAPPRHNSIKAEEKKLNLGRSIIRAVSFLLKAS